ncbi:MAG TPA: DUF4349 domain-containing protein [Candidatus Limnocylindrales bacterium]|nr:DUF4349 domain-containing protein [Candidatus Limnocylindrales bacterium]
MIRLRLARARGLRGFAPLAVVVLVVAACGSSSSILSTVGGPVGDEASGPGAVPAASAAATNGRDQSQNGSGKSLGGGGGQAPVPVDESKIVKTGSLDLQVADLAATLNRAHAAIAGLGGYVGQSKETNDGDRSTAVVTYRIPAARWDDAIGALRGFATKVLSEQTNAVEVTGQLIDLAARIDNLQASERALQAILEKAAKVQDILDVEARLSDVRGQIEQLQAQQAHLSDQAALGTLTVSYTLPVVATVEAQKKWSPTDEVDRATASLVDLLQTGAAAGIWFAIVWVPALLFLAVLLAVVVFVVRRLGLIRPRVPGPDAADAA